MIAQNIRLRLRSPWAGLALVSGLLATWLPVTAAGGILGLAVLLAILLVEPALALILMLGVAPLKTLITTETSVALPADIGQITFALAVFVWMVRRAASQPHEPLPRTRFYIPLLIILAGFTPSLFSATSTAAWVSEAIKWIEMLLLIGIVLDQSRRWEWIAGGIVLAGVLQAIIGLYEFYGGSGAAHLWIRGYQNFRAFGTFGQPNPFSAFMGLTLPLAAGLAYGYGRQGWKDWRWENGGNGGGWRNWRNGDKKLLPLGATVVYGLSAAILLGGLVTSWGRGAWLGFGAAAGVMVFFAPRKRWLAFLLLGLAGTIGVGLWLAGLIPASVEDRLDNAITEFVGFGDMRGKPISNDNFAIVERLAHWQAAYYMANDQPFTGVGLGNYEFMYAQYGIPSWPRPLGHAHNDYLNILAETGMIGLTAYLTAWAAILVWTLRALKQTDLVLRGLVLGLLGTWTHLAVHSVVDKLYVNNLFLHIGVMLGLLAVCYHRDRQGFSIL